MARVPETTTTEQRAAFTPGPWIVLAGADLRDVGGEGVADDALIIASITQDRTNHEHGKADVICDLWTLGFNGEGDPARRAEEEANANLIAAAPELLAALKEMREACAAGMRVLHIAGLEEPFLAEARAVGVTDGFGKRADELIAKAEGR